MTDTYQFDKDLLETGARLKGHFKLRSGRCGDEFFQIAMLARKPLRLRRACRTLVEGIRRQGISSPDVVVGPATGGIAVAQEIAAAYAELGHGEPDAVYAERARYDADTRSWRADPAADVFRMLRGFDRFVADRRVLIVEDALTTGGSCGRVAACVRELNGRVQAVAVLVQRGEVRVAELEGVPLVVHRRFHVSDWDPADCPMCARGEPFTPIPGK